MKVLTAILMFVTLGIMAKAQVATSPAPARVISENNRGVKNAPFSADAVNESVQILPDGNRIVRSSTSKMYRNSEGRFRQEGTGGSGGMLGSFYSYFGDGVSVFSPMGGSFSLDTSAKVARVFEGVAAQGISLAATAPLAAVRSVDAIKLSPAAMAEIEARSKGGQGTVDQSSLSPAARAEIEALKSNAQSFKIDAEKYKVDAEKFRAEAEKFKVNADELRLATTINGSAMFPTVKSKWDTRTEELGEQNIEGVNARGTRTITTIPAGAIGNERPIETVYEKWYSTELQMIVYSKHSDPRFGEQTYKLTNINRSEPDSSLFQVPTGYKVVSGGGKGTYTYTPTTSKAQQVERATGVRSATTGVRKVKPQQN